MHGCPGRICLKRICLAFCLEPPAYFSPYDKEIRGSIFNIQDGVSFSLDFRGSIFDFRSDIMGFVSLFGDF